MVSHIRNLEKTTGALSVLALSSRFDGQISPLI